MSVEIPARAAATAWLNAFLATSQEESRPALYRTLCVELFGEGVQFIGCDGTALFRAWVPREEGLPWPELDEAPVRRIVVMDVDGFGLGFMRSLVRVTAKDGPHAFDTLTIGLAPHDYEATLALGEDFMTERVTLRACGQHIDLRTFAGPFPPWRSLRLDAADVERVDGMTFATRLLGLIAKLKGVASVDLSFHGDTRHVAFITGADTVRGLIMPMRRLKTLADEA